LNVYSSLVISENSPYSKYNVFFTKRKATFTVDAPVPGTVFP